MNPEDPDILSGRPIEASGHKAVNHAANGIGAEVDGLINKVNGMDDAGKSQFLGTTNASGNAKIVGMAKVLQAALAQGEAVDPGLNNTGPVLSVHNPFSVVHVTDAPQSQGNFDEQTVHPGPAPEAKPFSWLGPHAICVIFIIGPKEIPFAIQRDFLASKSGWLRRFLVNEPMDNAVSYTMRRPELSVHVFAHMQNWLYTGQVFSIPAEMPNYETLIDLWMFSVAWEMDGLCDATLDAMVAVRNVTKEIPGQALLATVWDKTSAGTSIRKLLLEWLWAYFSSMKEKGQSKESDEFLDSLPTGIMKELLTTKFDSASNGDKEEATRRSTHQVNVIKEEPLRKRRRSETFGTDEPSSATVRTSIAGRKALPTRPPSTKRTAIRRRTGGPHGEANYSAAQKLEFCADLLNRMVSGPSFWTRFVGPFKGPVDPVRDQAPNYFDVVTKPMDLGTMKTKMDGGEYHSEQEFLDDMNQIFANVWMYWPEGHYVWTMCVRLEKTFKDKYGQMDKWIWRQTMEKEDGGKDQD